MFINVLKSPRSKTKTKREKKKEMNRNKTKEKKKIIGYTTYPATEDISHNHDRIVPPRITPNVIGRRKFKTETEFSKITEQQLEA